MNTSTFFDNQIAITISNMLAGATLTLYSGTIAATPEDDPPSGDIGLVSLPVQDVTVSGGAISFTCPQTMAGNSGIVTWGRLFNATNTLFDLTAGLAGSGTDIVLDSVTIYAGGSVTISVAQLMIA